jgi:hypothetical protein
VSETRLPSAPFRDWILRMVAELGTQDALEAQVGHDLHKIASGQYRTVGLDLVDEILAAAGVHLSDVYPDLYATDDLEPLPERRGGWKRPDKWCRYSRDQLRVLYKIHLEHDQSINALAKATYEKLGYSSHGSAASAISNGWKRMGLKARDRIEMCRIASTIHGRAPKHGPRPGYKTFLCNQRGYEWRPPCKGIKRQPPRKGSPCLRSAMEGSDYCVAHDPLRMLENQARLVRARSLLPQDDMLPMAPFSEWLDRLAAEHGSLKAACKYHGLRHDSACRYRKGEGTDGQPKTEIAKATVERWLEPTGTDLEDVYPVGERLAA